MKPMEKTALWLKERTAIIMQIRGEPGALNNDNFEHSVTAPGKHGQIHPE
jgi:hypothetical protein